MNCADVLRVRTPVVVLLLGQVVELEWYQSVVKGAADGGLKPADSPKVYWDLVLEHRVRELMTAAHKKYKQYVSGMGRP